MTHKYQVKSRPYCRVLCVRREFSMRREGRSEGVGLQRGLTSWKVADRPPESVRHPSETSKGSVLHRESSLLESSPREPVLPLTQPSRSSPPGYRERRLFPPGIPTPVSRPSTSRFLVRRRVSVSEHVSFPFLRLSHRDDRSRFFSLSATFIVFGPTPSWVPGGAPVHPWGRPVDRRHPGVLVRHPR